LKRHALRPREKIHYVVNLILHLEPVNRYVYVIGLGRAFEYLGKGPEDVILRMNEFIREIPVVSEEHHAFGVVVEPAHGKNSLLYVDEAHHRRPPHVIGKGAYETLGLVQKNVNLRPLETYKLSVNVYAV